jgi:KDO2-lipid IV(A) lauroyltransferase
MTKKEIIKPIKRYFGWLGLVFFLAVIKILPRRFIYAFARGAAGLGYYIAGKKRKIALDNLNIAFGKEKTPAEIERIAKGCFHFLAKNGLEFLYLIQKPHLVKQAVDLKGGENLDACLKRGKGVIILTAHFGNFPLMMLRLKQEGYNIYGIMRRMRDERVERLFSNKRRQLGVSTIHSQPRKTCVEESLKALRNNGLLCIQLDQNFGTAGVFVDFFGRKAATATGPVVLALRTQAAILPSFILHNPDNTYSIILGPEYKLIRTDSYNDTLLINIQKLTTIIESYIRRFPAEWGWIHRRWKSRPS